MDALGNFMTKFARIVVRPGEVHVYDSSNKFVFTLHGQELRNLSGNAEYINHFFEYECINRLVGFTPTEKGQCDHHADLVFEVREDSLIDVGFEADDKYLFLPMDVDTIYLLLKACELSLGSSRSFLAERDFWVLYAELDGYRISMSGLKFEIANSSGGCISIPRERAEIWQDIFSEVDDLEDCLVGSFVNLKEDIRITKVSGQTATVTFSNGSGVGKYRFGFRLCRILLSLLGSVWFFDEREKAFEIVDDDDDEEEGGVR